MTGILDGRTALVTGGSRGIGRQIASNLAEAGAEVVLTSRTEADALRVAEEIVQRGGRAMGVAMDVSDAASVEGAVAELLQKYGRIPILVNNAGITRDNLLMRMKEEDWNMVLQTNLTGVYRLCKVLVPSMVRAKYGRIVNITSVVSQLGNAGQINYTAAKAGVEGMSRSLARELASRNITVNCVAPGFIDTDMTRGLNDGARKKLLDRIPLKRLGRSDDVAAATSFLVGPGGDYVTGITMNVNGGMYM